MGSNKGRTQNQMIPASIISLQWAGYSSSNLTLFCFNQCVCKLVVRLKVVQEGELHEEQILIIFILKIYILKYFTMIQCRCIKQYTVNFRPGL